MWGNVPLLVQPSQSAHTPVSSLRGPCRVVIRVKPFEAGLIASCMTVWWGVFPLRIDFIMPDTLSLTLGALYVCHFFIIMLLWPALALSVRRHAKMFLHCCFIISVIEDMVFPVSLCVVILTIFTYNEWCRPSLRAWFRPLLDCGSILPTFFSQQRLCPQSTKLNLSA